MSPGRVSRRLRFAVLALIVALANASPSRAEKPAYRPGELLIKFREGTPGSERDHVLTDLGATRVRGFDRIKVEHLRIKSSVDRALRRYRRHPAVEYVEPNYILKAVATPNDPMFPLLWGMRNQGQTGGTSGADISATLAWDIARGDSAVLVGIIDTGTDYTHPDLQANIYSNPLEIPGNGLDDDDNGFVDDVRGWDFANNDNDPMDDHSHGTHVAGTIGGVGNNGQGVVGVSWTVRIVPIKFLDFTGSGSTSDAIAAVDYAIRIGVRVINASWGGPGFSQGLNDAIAAAGAQGILFVAAAGNDGVNLDVNPFYPAAYDLDNIVTVAATNHNDALASFSNYGVHSVDIAAPGVDILSTLPNNNYGSFSGTSMAAPHVVGALALVLDRYPGITAPEAKALILERGDDVAALSGRVGTGKRLNALLPIAANDSLSPGAITDLSVVAAQGSRATLAWTAPGDDGSEGTASSYDVRFSTSPIDAENFLSATPAGGEPDPDSSGAHQETDVHGLAFGIRYYFAIVARDELGNVSPLSNVASGVTLGPPDIAVSPDSLTADLLTGASTSRTVTISNSGVSELAFTISIEPTGAPLTVDAIAPRGVQTNIVATGAPMPVQRIADDTQPFPARLDLPAPIDRGSGAPSVASGPGRTVLSPLEEVFGGPDNVFFGDHRARGNVFSCSKSRRLLEHRFYLSPSSSGPVWFLVYEGDSMVGPFNLVSVSSLTVIAPTAGWYSSGTIDQPLVEGRYYLIIAAFEQTAEYRNRTGIAPYPIEASFGSLIAGAGWNWAPPIEFPPAPLMFVPSDVYGSPVAYWQTLVTEDGITWVQLAPDSGTVGQGSQLDVAVGLDATGLNGGDYRADVMISSNDPDESEVRVPVHMHVTGAADIDLDPPSLDFGTPFIGVSVEREVVVRNLGTDQLTVSGVSATPGVFTAPGAGFSLAPGATHSMLVQFAPTSAGVVTGTLTVTSDDPDEPNSIVTLRGEGLIPPDVFVSPDSFFAELEPNEAVTRVVTIRNDGGSALQWSAAGQFRSVPNVVQIGAVVAHPPDAAVGKDHAPPAGTRAPGETSFAVVPPATVPEQIQPEASLESVRDALEQQYGAVTSAIPNLYYFSEGESGEGIGDGGDDMYDYGNLLSTELGGFLAYTNGPIASSPYLGAGGRYFTRKYPGLFVLGADLSVNQFAINGNLGADGGGSVDGAVLEVSRGGHVWRAFVKRVFNATDPSVNHLILVRDPGAATHQYATNTDDDYQSVTGLSSPRLYYLLYAGSGGGYIGNAETLTILERFLGVITVSPEWLSVSPDSGMVAPGGSQTLDVTMQARELLAGDYDADVVVTSNDPDESDARVGVQMRVLGRPDIAVTPDSLDLGSLFIGLVARDSVRVRNAGNDLLTVSGVAAAPGVFTAPSAGFTLDPGATRDLEVQFAPTSPGEVTGTLTVTSEDPDEPSVVVMLRGEGLIPPDVSVSPDSFYAELGPNEGVTRAVTIRNDGGSPLIWSAAGAFRSVPAVVSVGAKVASPPDATVTKDQARPAGARAPGETYTAAVPAAGAPIGLQQEPPLASVRDALDLHFGAVTGVIPNRYDFYDGEFGEAISDGGDDMYDYGNLLATEFGGYLTYTNGPVVETPYLGVGGRYFTRKYPGLFVLGADLSASRFSIYGNLGADGGGNVDAAVLETTRGGHTWRAFVKRVFNAYDPSVNHMIVVRDPGAATHEYSLFTDDDYHSVTGLSSPRLYYLLYAGYYGGYIGNAEAMTIFDRFLDAVAVAPDWLSVSPDSGVVPVGESRTVDVTMQAGELLGGYYDADVVVSSNDPDDSEARVGVQMRVLGRPDIAVTPDSLDLDSLFIGLVARDTVRIRNAGNDLLTVSGVAAAPGVFTAPSAGFTLAPGATRAVEVQFAPTSAGFVTGTLTVTSDDPDEPSVVVTLRGVGLTPPDVSVTPSPLNEHLYTNEQVVRMLHVENLGGSDLQFIVAVAGGAGPEPSAPNLPESTEPVEDDVDSRSAPAQYVAQSTSERITFGFGVLLVQDVLPWGSNAVEVLLNLNHIPYDRIPSSLLAAFDLTHYHTVIVPSDQFYSTYAVLMAQASRLQQFVAQGGVLEFHAAGLGFNGGDPSGVPLPGGMQIVNSFSSNNYVLLPQHPLVAGVPSPFTGGWASHAGFVNVPAGAEIVARDDRGFPNLVSYPYGLGRVVTGGQTFEFGYEYNQSAGRILVNMIPYANNLAPPWLRIGLESGVVPPGGTVDIPVTLDATGLDPGDYAARVLISSNDPDESLVTVRVNLHVTGSPLITVAPDSVDFDSQYVGATAYDSVRVRNLGTETLHVSQLTATPATFGVNSTGFSVPRGGIRAVAVSFAPTHDGLETGTLTIASDDPRQPTLTVDLRGTGLPPPDIALSPDSMHVLLQPGETGSSMLKLSNHGTGPLIWTAAGQFREDASTIVSTVGWSVAGEASPRSTRGVERSGGGEIQMMAVPPAAAPQSGSIEAPLEDVLHALDVDYSSVTSVIPRRYDFTEGITGVNILDGGANLYDTGNYLNTNLDGPTPYSNGTIRTAPMFGASERYFTRKYPGLFVLAADAAGIEDLWIGGNLGADGQGNVSGAVFEMVRNGHVWRGFTKRVYNASPPSVNHLVIVRDPGAATHSFAASTNDDYHRVSNLHVPRVYYLLYSAREGFFIDDAATQLIMERFVQAVDLGPKWLEVTPSAGVVAPGDSAEIEVRSNAGTLVAGRYDAQVGIFSNDPDHGLVTMPIRLDVLRMPRLSVSAHVLDFGAVLMGGSATRTLRVQNTGSLALQIASIQASRADYQSDYGAFTLAPAETAIVSIAGSPQALGDRSGLLTIASNDPVSPAIVSLAMSGIPQPVAIDLELDPNHLHLGSPHMGRWVTAYLEPPAPKRAEDIVLESIRLNGTLTIDPSGPHEVGDHDQDGVHDLMVKFSRLALAEMLSSSASAPVQVTGLVGAEAFVGRDTIDARSGRITRPAAGAVLAAGAPYTIEYEPLAGPTAQWVAVLHSLDNGVTWISDARLRQHGNTVSWVAPNVVGVDAILALVEVEQQSADSTDVTGVLAISETFHLANSLTVAGVPGALALAPVTPNPASGDMRFRFVLPSEQAAELAVFDVGGRKVRTLVSGIESAGSHELVWRGDDETGRIAPAGVYVARLTTASGVRVRRFGRIR
jgi:subtilisin family serine protease